METRFTFENLLLAGICEHNETWERGSEKRFFENVTRELRNGDVQHETLTEIMTYFKVVRGVPNKSDGQSREVFAKNVTQLIRDWPDDLFSRAEALVSTAAKLKQSKVTHVALESGLSKLIWFAKPYNWSMYDRLAFNALRHEKFRKLKKGSTRGKQFYRTMNDLEFVEMCDAMRPVLASVGLNNLWPERLIDKALWIMGTETNYKLIQNSTNDKSVGPEMREAANLMAIEPSAHKMTHHLQEKFGLA